ncbi:MAG: glycosyltransferase [bacterium]|nr:glycosyltransferase [Gammaproteobacteria bacterium]HIL98530.1 glycosyltransferase [Pseudomonadales bacterium]
MNIKVIVLSRSIAIVIDPWDYPFNGAVVSTRRFVKVLENQFSFKLLATPADNEKPDRRMVQFGRVSIPGFNHILDEMKVPLARPDRKLLRQALQGCELLHVQFPFFLGFVAISEARKLGLPVICSFHVQPENLLLNVGIRSRWISKILYKFFIAAFYNRADMVIAPSEFAAEELRSQGLVKTVKVISNGVPEHFLSLLHTSGGETGAEQVHKLLSVGRLAKEKQQDVLLRAIARSKYKNSIELTMVGTGPQEEELRKLAARLELNVTIGSVSDETLLTLLTESDLFVHAGEIELEGMSVVEAMAAGNTVIVSDSRDSAAAMLVDNPQALFRNRNPVDLAAKIDYWLANPKEKLIEAKSNRQRAGHRSHADCVAQFASLYNELMAVELPAENGITQFE